MQRYLGYLLLQRSDTKRTTSMIRQLQLNVRSKLNKPIVRMDVLLVVSTAANKFILRLTKFQSELLTSNSNSSIPKPSANSGFLTSDYDSARVFAKARPEVFRRNNNNRMDDDNNNRKERDRLDYGNHNYHGTHYTHTPSNNNNTHSSSRLQPDDEMSTDDSRFLEIPPPKTTCSSSKQQYQRSDLRRQMYDSMLVIPKQQQKKRNSCWKQQQQQQQQQSPPPPPPDAAIAIAIATNSKRKAEDMWPETSCSSSYDSHKYKQHTNGKVPEDRQLWDANNTNDNDNDNNNHLSNRRREKNSRSDSMLVIPKKNWKQKQCNFRREMSDSKLLELRIPIKKRNCSDLMKGVAIMELDKEEHHHKKDNVSINDNNDLIRRRPAEKQPPPPAAIAAIATASVAFAASTTASSKKRKADDEWHNNDGSSYYYDDQKYEHKKNGIVTTSNKKRIESLQNFSWNNNNNDKTKTNTDNNNCNTSCASASTNNKSTMFALGLALGELAPTIPERRRNNDNGYQKKETTSRTA
ncbi:hypothetical protein FRACYDRAFT_244320 [Fragilariopsis cylindrus CCMP1102]|uniref:Uncharacterized protein n=1 Tax=Fragilariopsis cylindrus CCMP1102 TaxID=635003 RepID=A0A1E7F1T6_9STRA|nr:hypothetical protein FRACYDRAFT_244320 [Fragilariopsis cylindrus CCMP1102]|eukprot:OEU12079.1 hypothetical protein FRACYDRAFT_244320 [Fragilariopsis cylindrus CCMP1102]